jgi:phosphoribosylamine--glycine ligase
MRHYGHAAQAYLEGGVKVFDGLLDKAHDINELNIESGDMVIFDMVGGGRGADKLINKGIYVVGASGLTDKLELDREFGMRFMKKHGIPIPPSIFVDTIDEAKQIVQKTGKRYVFKPDGNQPTDLTYVSHDAEDMLNMLDYFQEKVPDETDFVLQEFVEGIEMSTEGFFNGSKFLHPLNSTFEAKRFMDGDLGPNTGCAGNVVWFWDRETSDKLYSMLFESMEEELAKSGYIGPVDINAIWTEKGPYGLEFTARFGYDAIQCSSRLIDMELGEFLHELRNLEEVPINNSSYAMSVRVSIPPYPSEGDIPEIPIDLAEAPTDNIYLSDVYLKDGNLRCAGQDGYVVCVAEDGKRLNQLTSRVYEIADQLEIPSKQYRLDISDRVEKDRAAIQVILGAI